MRAYDRTYTERLKGKAKPCPKVFHHSLMEVIVFLTFVALALALLR